MFKTLTDTMLVASQICVDDIARASALGVTTIINNRPDGESPDQTAGAEIAAVATAAGIAYVAIPVTHAGFSMPQIKAMAAAMTATKGKVLAYCRSGTRSTNLWALAQAGSGVDPEQLSRAAASAGYDLAPLRTMMDMLGSQNE